MSKVLPRALVVRTRWPPGGFEDRITCSGATATTRWACRDAWHAFVRIGDVLWVDDAPSRVVGSRDSRVVEQPETYYARSGEVSIAYQLVGDGPFETSQGSSRMSS